MQEITARVAIEERLLLEGAIAANVAEGIVLVRASDGQIVYANDRWERMFGYDHGEPIGHPISIVNAPTGQAPEERAQEIIRAIDRNGTWSGEVHNVRKDGTRFWSAASISTFEHPEHGVVWAAVQTDMTERKAAEEALRAAEERFRQVFEDGPLGILIVDNDLRMIDANQAFSAITGYRREELVGRPSTDISHPDDLALESELGANLAAGEIPRYRIERRFVTKQGEAMPVIQTTTVVRGADGEPLYRVATVEELAGS